MYLNSLCSFCFANSYLWLTTMKRGKGWIAFSQGYICCALKFHSVDIYFNLIQWCIFVCVWIFNKIVLHIVWVFYCTSTPTIRVHKLLFQLKMTFDCIFEWIILAYFSLKRNIFVKEILALKISWVEKYYLWLHLKRKYLDICFVSCIYNIIFILIPLSERLSLRCNIKYSIPSYNF